WNRAGEVASVVATVAALTYIQIDATDAIAVWPLFFLLLVVLMALTRWRLLAVVVLTMLVYPVLRVVLGDIIFPVTNFIVVFGAILLILFAVLAITVDPNTNASPPTANSKAKARSKYPVLRRSEFEAKLAKLSPPQRAAINVPQW